MPKYTNTIITATGKSNPGRIVKNKDFNDSIFYIRNISGEGYKLDPKTPEKRVEKLYKRTGIKEREYKLEGKVASDLGAEAVINSGDNFSLWDCFGIAHDFGDCKFGTPEINWLPSIASQIVFREMQADRLSATPTVAYDVIANKNWYNFAKEVFASNDKKAYIIPQSERDRNIPEGLDYLIVVHERESMAERVKKKAGIENPNLICFDLLSGCPGWLELLIFSHYTIQAGLAKEIGTGAVETLSDVSDPADPDRMIYADKGGFVKVEARKGETKEGILSHASRTDSEFGEYLTLGKSSNPNYPNKEHLFLKMKGNMLFRYAVNNVPGIIRESLERADLTKEQIDLIFAHQANYYLDSEILGEEGLGLPKEVIKRKTPMNISWRGNSSVATIPVLLDDVLKGDMPDFTIHPRNVLNFFSVGAGPCIDSAIYKVPE
ncbi:MAG: 3-oxoacyl-[acyl-carrier-protein] synthase III C-terminal domain-containing protein [Candidatus Woesearchaeota archaeon]